MVGNYPVGATAVGARGGARHSPAGARPRSARVACRPPPAAPLRRGTSFPLVARVLACCSPTAAAAPVLVFIFDVVSDYIDRYILDWIMVTVSNWPVKLHSNSLLQNLRHDLQA